MQKNISIIENKLNRKLTSTENIKLKEISLQLLYNKLNNNNNDPKTSDKLDFTYIKTYKLPEIKTNNIKCSKPCNNPGILQEAINSNLHIDF